MTYEPNGRRSRSIGAFVGLAIGDALGAPIQFKRRDTYEHVSGYTAGGTYQLEPGYWTDDTSMALCLAETLLSKGNYDPVDFGDRLVRWVDEGYNSSLPKCFDIGQTTLRAIGAYRRHGHDDCGITGEWAGGNGSIMRLAPVPIFYQEFSEFAEQVSVTQGILTHNHEVPNDGCRLLSKIIIEGIRTGDKHAALSSVETLQVADKILHVKNREYEEKDRNRIKSDGYVVSTLEAAMWSVWKTDNFKDALLLAVNLGDDADTVGAVAGQIAGAIYGIEEIPKEWVSDLTQSPRILEYSQKLFEQRHTP
jgi:ADP-ribosyl-[dinitrogen reductase] hydrolase